MPSNSLGDDMRTVLIFYKSLAAHFVSSSRGSETLRPNAFAHYLKNVLWEINLLPDLPSSFFRAQTPSNSYLLFVCFFS